MIDDGICGGCLWGQYFIYLFFFRKIQSNFNLRDGFNMIVFIGVDLRRWWMNEWMMQ